MSEPTESAYDSAVLEWNKYKGIITVNIISNATMLVSKYMMRVINIE